MTITLRGGYTTTDRRLDRLPSATDEHFEKYPLSTAQAAAANTSMVAGINWYSDFDHPRQLKINGRLYWVIGTNAQSLGKQRGGHAVCLRNYKVRDSKGWWTYYNQGVEGRCVEFATLRMLSQANRRRYDITSRWHYHEMQRTDEWEGGSYPGATPHYEGTSARAGLEVVRAHGAIRARWRGHPITAEDAPSLLRPEDGIETYRWADPNRWDDVRLALNVPDWMPGVPVNNSWGRSYPHEVILLDDAGARVLAERGEFGIVTDR